MLVLRRMGRTKFKMGRLESTKNACGHTQMLAPILAAMMAPILAAIMAPFERGEIRCPMGKQ